MKVNQNINSDILIWAVERAGLSPEEISQKIPKFPAWLEGEAPTLRQLESFAKKVHLPFGYLFLKEPPEEKIPFPFFRTGNSNESKVSINVYDTILLLQQRQEWLTDYLKESEYESLSFVGKFKNNLDIQNIVADIRQTLELDPDWADSIPSWNKAKNFLAQKIEDIGITVVFNSVVGNNTHRKITVDECRGFVLVDDIAPFMFVNSADYKSAQMFTLAHELAHIWIGKSAGFDFRQMLPAQNDTEILCDKIAAEFLVPSEIFNSVWAEYNNFEKLAGHFKVGQIVVARRALDLGKISRTDFFEFYREYSSQEKVKKENRESGGDFYKTQKKRLGLRFLNNVNQAIRENKLLVRDAYQLTGLKGNSFNNLVEGYLF